MLAFEESWLQEKDTLRLGLFHSFPNVHLKSKFFEVVIN